MVESSFLASKNLYAHFPFCRRKCAYCSLYSRVGVSQPERDAYAESLARKLGQTGRMGLEFSGTRTPSADCRLSTVYFGGGSPALCDLKPVFEALSPWISESTEFTVELHPLDVTDKLLSGLRDGGVNRISMGVQSFDDATLARMGRGYAAREALQAFERVTRYFDNAGIDLIVGFPDDPGPLRNGAERAEARKRGGRFSRYLKRFAEVGMKHCSVYSLQNERGLENVPDDDALLDGIREVAAELKELGLERYEISNYAAPGCECRHNLAVWRGEDYLGVGEGACGRVGLARTRVVRRRPADGEESPETVYETETLSPETDLKERTVFRLRTRDGLDSARFPSWVPALDRFVAGGLLVRDPRSPSVYRLTARGAEVCDSILAEIV